MDVITIVNLSSTFILFLFSIYFLVMSSFVKDKKTVLLLALIVFITTIRSLLRVPVLFDNPDTNDLLRRIDHFTYYGGFPLFIAFCYEFLKSRFHRQIRNITFYVSIPYILFLFFPERYYLQFRFLYQIFSLLIALYVLYVAFSYLFLKEEYAKVRFVGILSIFLGFVADVLIVITLEFEPFIVPLALIIFSSSYTIFISYSLGKQRNQLLQYQEELTHAKEEIEQQYLVTKEQQNQLETLTRLYQSLLELSKKLSSTSDFKAMIEEIEYHLEKIFGIKYFIILLVNSKEKRAYPLITNLRKQLSKEKFDFMMSLQNIDLNSKGIHNTVYVHKKYIYFPKFNIAKKRSAYEPENQLVEILNLKSVLIFPLIYNDEVFGFFDITYADKPLRLTKNELLNLNIFVQYFSQLLRNYLFLEEIQKQRQLLEQYNEELTHAKEEIEQQFEITKSKEEELRKLNQLYTSLLELSRKIASTSDFDAILNEISFHLEKNFGIKYFVIMTIDAKNERAYYYNSNLNKRLGEEQFEFMARGVEYFDLTYPGMHRGVFKNKKPLYLRRFKKSGYEFENQLVERLRLRSLIVFPLIYNDEVFGFFDITHADEPLHLSKEEYLNLNIFIQYFSQIFRNHLFVQEIQRQKKQVEEKNQEIIQKNKLILEMNTVLTEINQASEIKKMLELLIRFLERNFNLKYYLLYLYNPEKKVLEFFSTNGQHLLEEEKWNLIKNNHIPIDNGTGIHASACKKNRYIYFPNALKRKTNCEVENENQKHMQMKSIIIFPLRVGKELVGTLDISHIENPIILNRVQLSFIKIFIDQFAAVFRNQLLLEQIQSQKQELETINREISERNRVILAMNETLAKIDQIYDIKEILDMMIQFLSQYFSLKYYLFYRYDRNKNALIYTYSNGEYLYPEEEIQILKQTELRLEDNGIHASCCKNRKHIHLRKIKQSADERENNNQRILKMRSLLIFPLYAGEELLGTLDFSHFQEKLNLTKVQISLIKIFVDRFAIILKNILLIEKLEQQHMELEKSLLQLELAKQEAEKLNEFTKKINSQTDFHTIIQDIFQYFEKTYQLKFGWLILIDEGKRIFKSSAFSNDYQKFPVFVQEFLNEFEVPLNQEGGMFFRTYKKKKYLYITRISNEFQRSIWNHSIVDMLKLEWFLNIPLIVQDRVIGILFFTNYSKKIRLNLDRLRSIQYFGDQIAGALYNSYLLEEIHKEKQKSELAREELQQLNEFTKQIFEEENFEKLVQNIFRYLKKRFSLQFGWLLLIDREKDRIRTSSFSRNVINLSKEMYDYLMNFNEELKPELGTIYRTYKRKKFFYLKKINPEYIGSQVDKDLIRITKIKWVLYIPLILKEEVIGILAFTNYEKQIKLTKSNIESINTFCSQIVGAVYNSFLRENIAVEKEKAEKLLLNILPKKIAEELKENGYVKPKLYQNVSIMFTDFVGFTKYASEISPDELIRELDRYFYQFDEITARCNLTKLKTIGDAYMCVGGLPEENKTHAVDVCLAALEMQSLMKQTNEIKQSLHLPTWELRIGINTGPVVAGVIGKERFAYDIWGDTVNVAQRLESSSKPYHINISRSTYEQVKYFFQCEYRGKHAVKNRGFIDMFFLKRIHPRFSKDPEGRIPNENFKKYYEKLKNGAKFVFKHEIKEIGSKY